MSRTRIHNLSISLDGIAVGGGAEPREPDGGTPRSVLGRGALLWEGKAGVQL